MLSITGMHPDRCGLAGQAGRDGEPMRRLLPVRLWQLHRGDRHSGRSDTNLDVLHPWGQAGRASEGTPRRRNQGQRSKAFPDGQVGFPVLHGQGDYWGSDQFFWANWAQYICIQTAGLEPLKLILKKMGGWPLLEGPTWNEEGYKWWDLVEDGI